MQDWLKSAGENWTDVGSLGGLFLIGALTAGDRARHPWMLAATFTVVAVSFYGKLVSQEGARFLDLAILLLSYAVALYVLLTLAVRHAAARLTAWRGGKWVKEIDYLYTGLGGVGVLVALARLDGVADRVDWLDLAAPLLLATALVLRLIKTRAEIENWNTPSVG